MYWPPSGGILTAGPPGPSGFRREMLTRLELALTRWEGELLEALKADLNKSPYEGYMSELGPTLAELRFARGHLKKWARPVRHPAPCPSSPPWALCTGSPTACR